MQTETHVGPHSVENNAVNRGKVLMRIGPNKTLAAFHVLLALRCDARPQYSTRERSAAGGRSGRERESDKRFDFPAFHSRQCGGGFDNGDLRSSRGSTLWVW